MSNFFKEQADKRGWTGDDVAYELARIGCKVTGSAVRNWFAGLAPSLRYADPLAKVFGVNRAKILEVMHEMKIAAQEAAAAAK